MMSPRWYRRCWRRPRPPRRAARSRARPRSPQETGVGPCPTGPSPAEKRLRDSAENTPHATRLGVPSVIVMPTTTPNVKVVNTEKLGARVVLHGRDLTEAATRARELVVSEGLVWVPPYDDAAIIAGQGTTALELLHDAPDIEVIVVPVGGGGLIAGMAGAAEGA